MEKKAVREEDKFREGAKLVHKYSGQIIIVLSNHGPFVRALPLGHDVPVHIVPEHFKYYEPYQVYKGSM